MGKYLNKSCPHCKYRYYHKRSYAGEDRLQYGSPLRTCPNCHMSFIDHDYVEPAISGMLVRDSSGITISQLFFGLAAIAFGAVFLIGNLKTKSIIGIALPSLWILFWVWAIISNIISKPEREKNYELELEKSKQRLSNPAYAWQLKELGLDVPKEYLVPINDDSSTVAVKNAVSKTQHIVTKIN